MMKRISYSTTFFVLFLILGSIACKKSNFLDQAASTDILTQQKVFSDSTNTFNFLNSIYYNIGYDVVPDQTARSLGGNSYGSLEQFTTYALNLYSSNPDTKFLTGQGSSTVNPFYFNNSSYNSYYSMAYMKIRAANQYMANVKNAPLSDAIKTRTNAEARFLRAFYYSMLIRVYGAVPLVGDSILTVASFDSANYKRNTMKECVDYITAQCDQAMQNLPSVTDQLPSDYGRVTAEACMALKARMLLMAASPLYNGSPISSDATLSPLLCYSSSLDASLWQKAADAFKAIINTNKFQLYGDNSIPGNGFRQLFLTRQNSEYILSYMIAPSAEIEQTYLPLFSTGASSNATGYPTQNLVDQFYMQNGLPINDPNSGYDPNNPYVGRDPRFYHTIIYNQANVYSKSAQKMAPVSIYQTIVNGVPVPTSDGPLTYQTRTGYYCRKMANDSVSTSTVQNRVYPIIRYAEVLLGYAEAMNEVAGPTTEVYNYVQQIRARAGIAPGSNGNYGLAPGMSKDAMRTIIQTEYKVELAYEGHWFYDSRRWRLAEKEETRPAQAMIITQASNGTYSYAVTPAIGVNTVFTPNMYYVPLPYVETLKGKVVQNPGWN